MQLALCQTKIKFEDYEYNIKAAEEYVCQGEAELYLFPEMSFTGFSQNIEITAKSAEKSINAVRRLCLRYKKAIGFGYTRKRGDKAENVYCIIDKEGRAVSEYVKLHPFSFSGEDKSFEGGSGLSVCKLGGFNIGTAICYDLRFPEVFTHMCRDCSLIIVPACWPEKRREHWLALLKARAIENQLYTAGINCFGNIGGLEYSGDSVVFSPNGEAVAEPYGKEGISFVTINNDVDEYRLSFPTVRDRREALYKELSYE